MPIESLSGNGWSVRATGPWPADAPPRIAGARFDAVVPGCIHDDLIRAGVIGDPNIADNEERCRWIGHTDWEYTRKFSFSAEFARQDCVELVCAGLDTIARIAVDGCEIGGAANMHHPQRFDLTAIEPGEHELVITFTTPLRHIHAEQSRLGSRPVNGDWDPYVFARKQASNFGWDWGPRVPTVGIWRDIYIHAWSGARIASARPHVLGKIGVGDKANALTPMGEVPLDDEQRRNLNDLYVVKVHVDIARPPTNPPAVGADANQPRPAPCPDEVEQNPLRPATSPDDVDQNPLRQATGPRRAGNTRAAGGAAEVNDLYLVATLYAPNGQPAYRLRGTIPRGGNSFVITMFLNSVELWWPRGHGGQPLYRLAVTLLRSPPVRDSVSPPPESVLDVWSFQFGMRTIRLDTSADADGNRFALTINGRPIFCRGANWIPEGLFPSRVTPALLRRRVEQAADANLNMLRVWGGGIYEDEAFYDACDEVGILVWQDFAFACATYPEDAPYPALVEGEVRHNIARLARHPSVALYCGGNECVWAYEGWGFKQRLAEGQSWGDGYYFDLLPRLVAELDPTRPYWPNTPYSGERASPLQRADRGCSHVWDLRDAGYRTIVPRFVTEFGHQSPSNYATLVRADSYDPSELRRRQRAAGGDVVRYDKPLSEWFGTLRDFDTWHFAAQLLQARAIATGIEWWRSNQPRCMGALFWQWNDCWAGHSWSAIDADGRRKPLWYAVRRACSPRLLTFQPRGDGVELVFVNETPNEWRTSVWLRRMAFDGRILAEKRMEMNVPALSTARVDAFSSVGSPTDRRAELLVANEIGEHNDEGVNALRSPRATWFFERDRELAYPSPRFSARVTPANAAGGDATLIIAAETLLRDVCLQVDRLDPAAECAEQLVTLLPGEEFAFTVEWNQALRAGGADAIAEQESVDLLSDPRCGQSPVLMFANSIRSPA